LPEEKWEIIMEQKITTQAPKRTLLDIVSSDVFKSQISNALPAHMSGARATRAILTEIRSNPKLLQCSYESFCSAVFKCAQLGLEIGSAFGQAYLIPFKDQCQLMVGYKGMIQLLYRAGNIKSIHADFVCEDDVFEYEFGLNQVFRHVPKVKDRSKNIVSVYAYAHLTDGGFEATVLSLDEVLNIKKISRSQDIWNAHFTEMAKKTALRRLFKILPCSPEYMDLIAEEDTMTPDLETTTVISQPATQELLETLNKKEIENDNQSE
jgi:recombination protein RecT